MYCKQHLKQYHLSFIRSKIMLGRLPVGILGAGRWTPFCIPDSIWYKYSSICILEKNLVKERWRMFTVEKFKVMLPTAVIFSLLLLQPGWDVFLLIAYYFLVSKLTKLTKHQSECKWLSWHNPQYVNKSKIPHCGKTHGHIPNVSLVFE